MAPIEVGESSIMTKVLFVCLGNICRSPAAEAVMQMIVEKAQAKDRYRLDSAGTSAYHAGEPADKRMIARAAHRKIHIPSIARQFVYKDFERFDLIVAMDESNYDNILDLDEEQQFHSKVVMMTDYSSGKFSHYNSVPDPYYGGSEGFDLVLDLLVNCCQNLFNHLEQNKR